MDLRQFKYSLRDSEEPKERWAKVQVQAPQNPAVRDKELLKYPGKINVKVTLELRGITQLQLIQLISSIYEQVARAAYGYAGTRLDMEKWFKTVDKDSESDSDE